MGHRLLNWSGHDGRHLLSIHRADRRPFAMATDKPHYSRDKRFILHHIRIEVSLDIPNKRVSGTSAVTVSPVTAGMTEVELDAVELQINAARLEGGQALAFERGDESVTVLLPSPLGVGERATVVIGYEATPRKGLYFVGPDEGYPEKPVHVWTQGEDQDSRYWVPCYDFPNQRATSEVVATVPEGMFALSNGRLAGSTHDAAAGTRTYHWVQEQPHVTYLITLAVGEYVKIEEDCDGVPLEYYVPPGREEDARRAFGKTPEMLRLFNRLAGLPYPWAKYAQITVADFIFGGMENTTATTLTDSTLHDQRAHLDFSSDFLVSHELAHQWFGDLLTCKDWSHAWLNEGFATYFEAMFTEHDLGEDEFRYEVYRNMAAYLSEASGHYVRPLVTRVYSEPIDLFDRHLYEKASLVLHMLRYVLGHDLFVEAVQRYVMQHRDGVVDTEDLRQAIEDVSGQTMEAFFEQWVYRSGHPDIKLAYSWDDEGKMATVMVTQRQDEGEHPLFDMPVTIDFHANGTSKSVKLRMAEKEHRFHVPLDFKPSMVCFDPGNNVLKSLEEDLSKDLHMERLRKDDDVVGRIRAAHALAKLGAADCVEALKQSVLGDPFWGVQAEAAAALGTIKSNTARDALLACIGVAHPKARRAVVAALGSFKDEAAAEALAALLQKGDESYFVEAEAARALGKTRSPSAYDALIDALGRDSHQDVIRAAAMDGLAELRDERGLEVAKEWAAYGKPQPVRSSAVGAAAKLGEERKDTVEYLSDFLYDPWLRVRLRTLDALESLGDAKAIARVSAMIDRELDGRVRRRAKEVIDSLRTGSKGKGEVKKLQDEIDKLQEQNKTLMDRLDKLEAKARQAS